MSPGSGEARRFAGAFLLPIRSVLFALAALVPATVVHALPPCSEASVGWCVARRFAGTVRQGELGFRFGDALDADGDGAPDVAAGSRFKTAPGARQNGSASVFSGSDGRVLFERDGTAPDGLFGHFTMLVPDLDGDGSADLVVSAPNAVLGGEILGEVTAWSPKRGSRIWLRRTDRRQAHLGWHLALTSDHDDDGISDIFAGAPMASPGFVELLSGRDGSVLHRYEAPERRSSFGWFLASAGDQDGDRRDDLVVGGAQRSDLATDARARAFLLSSADGKVLRSWSSDDPSGSFGEVVAAVGDLDGDRRKEIAIGASGLADRDRRHPGEVQVFSSRDGKELRRWQGVQAGELYGRMVASAGDVDGDGTDDVAIGAPWHAVGTLEKVGRVEIRSGKSGAIVAQWTGNDAGEWCGWHIRRGFDPSGRGRPALLVGSLRAGTPKAAGVIDLLLLANPVPAAQPISPPTAEPASGPASKAP